MMMIRQQIPFTIWNNTGTSPTVTSTHSTAASPTAINTRTLYSSNLQIQLYPSTIITTNILPPQHHPLQDQQTRNLGIRTKAKNRSKPTKSKKNTTNFPINEHLIRTLLNKTKNSTAESIQVRLLIDQGRDSKPIIEVMSLTDAIQVSSEQGVDLIGINLNQDVAVIKCQEYNKFLYQQNKKGSGDDGGGAAAKGPAGGGGNKSTKQYSFKAGIDDNDLERKATNMIEYLVKGHACQVTITSNRRNLKGDGNIIAKTLNRLKEIVGEDGNQQGTIKNNEWGNRGTLLLQPNSKKKSSK
jgi:translation initiation factor IF-3